MKRLENNKGLSLVEIILVVAIITVVGGVIGVGLSSAMSKPADECANKIMASLNNARLSTMGKNTLELKLTVEDGRVYLEEIVNGASTKKTQIGAKGVLVEYRLKGETNYIALADAPLTLSFERSTGGFKPCNGGPGYCEEIKISKGNKVLTLHLAHLTGKVTVN